MVDWTPVEDVARLVLDVAGITIAVPVSEISGYFHVVNNFTVRWEELANVIQEYYGGKIKALVSFEEWIQALEKTAASTAEMDMDMDKNPAIKLLDTYKFMLRAGEGHIQFQTSRATARSPAMAGLGPIKADLMRNWCEQWAF